LESEINKIVGKQTPIELTLFVFAFQTCFFKKLIFILFFSLLQINIFCAFSNNFDALISKIIFKK